MGLLFLISIIAAVLATANSSHAQPVKSAKLGLLVASTAAVQEPRLRALRAGLRELGYNEGQNLHLEQRFANGRPDRLPQLAGELVSLKPDILVAIGGTPPALAAKNATKSLPIVMTNVADAIGDGLVASLAQPGGNLTGFSTFAPELSGKRLELLKELLPGLSRVAVLASREFSGYGAQIKEVQAAAQGLGLQIDSVDVRGAADLEPGFAAIDKSRARAVVTLSDPVTFSLLKQIVALAIKQRLPSIHLQVEYANAGALVSYGPSYTDLFYRAATYVDKILKGTKPGDLPIEQPRKFELVINLKAGKQIGLTIPPNVLARADRVIR